MKVTTARKIRKAIILALTVINILYSFAYLPTNLKGNNPNDSARNSSEENKVLAESQYSPTSGEIVVGNTIATDANNSNSFTAAYGSDDNDWQIQRTGANPSLNVQFSFGQVRLNNANKLIISIEDSNTTTGTAYSHQICDWVNGTDYDFAPDTKCTGGGWRTLHPRKTDYTSTSDVLRNYSIYNGYFVDTTTAPGTPVDTPLSNFIDSSTNKVLIRVYSAAVASTVMTIDTVQIEFVIDSVYEPAALDLFQAGTKTGYQTDLVGGVSTNLTGSDNNKLVINMPAINQSIDARFIYKNVRSFGGANTLLVSPELCVSNSALTYTFYLYNYTTLAWTQIGGTYTSAAACGTDYDFALSFNSSAISGFNYANHISSGNEVTFRILTNAPGTSYSLQLDRLYMMLGSVNSDTNKCEISWGTGTASNCQNTRIISQIKATTPSVSTWQATAALEYPSSYYALDNDDDTTNAEYATSQNLSFPIQVSSNMAVRAVHYAAEYRSNNAAQTADLQIRDYSGITTGPGWINTPGADTNLATTYSWYDSWNLVPYESNAQTTIDTENGLANLRLRTSAGTTTNPGTRDWAFAMMSIRWVEEPNRVTVLNRFTPTGGFLKSGAGTEVATSYLNTGSWKGTIGIDSTTAAASNYWVVARSNPGGLNQQLMFDNVNAYDSNKIIITVKDTNLTTGTAYSHQICDWESLTGVDVAADTECTGGGWRTLNPISSTNYTNTADTVRQYDIYNGYFSSRDVAPGTIYDTPIGNFIRDSDNRVLIRIYSTVASTVQMSVDYASVEFAVDPVYEASLKTNISPFNGGTAGYFSDIRGTLASDNSKFTIANNATNPMNLYFSFNNVKSYIGANTILIRPEICVSNTALTFNWSAYNYITGEWTDFLGSPQTGTACTTDTTYSFSKNGINFNNYVRNGELRIRLFTNTLNAHTLSLDRLFIMIGSTNSDFDDCAITWGTGDAKECANTRTVSDPEGGSTNISGAWSVTNALEYLSTFTPLDNDDDATGAEAAVSANLGFPITLSKGMAISAVHYATRYRSNDTTERIMMTYRDYGGHDGTSGWILGAPLNYSATYSWFDSRTTPIVTSPGELINTVTNKMNARFRTSVSTDTTVGEIANFDFAMQSIRWVQLNPGLLSADIVDAAGASVSSPSLSFSAVETGFSCQTSTATLGVADQKIRINNSTASPSWTLSISANDGNSSTWQAAGSNYYDFNDSSGTPPGCADGADSDSYAGQLSFDFSGATITPKSGCNNTGLTLGSTASFEQGTTDSISVLTAGSSAGTDCYWDVTGISVTQKVPGDQASGAYSIPMILTVVAN